MSPASSAPNAMNTIEYSGSFPGEDAGFSNRFWYDLVTLQVICCNFLLTSSAIAPDVRQAAAYGVGVCAQFGGENYTGASAGKQQMHNNCLES